MQNKIQEQKIYDALNPYLMRVTATDEDKKSILKCFRLEHIHKGEDFMSCGIDLPEIVILLEGTIIVEMRKPFNSKKNPDDLQCTDIYHLPNDVIIIEHSGLDTDDHAPETFVANSDCTFIYINKNDLAFLRKNIPVWSAVEVLFYRPALNNEKNNRKNLLVFDSLERAQKFWDVNKGKLKFANIKLISSLLNFNRNFFKNITDKFK